MGTRKVILVADDEAALRNLIRALLHDEGYEVLAAVDGNEALRLSRTHQGPIDLLLTDVDMPRLDGISAYQRISAERADIKVLFMSGAIPESLDVLHGLPFLPKPFVIDELSTKVRDVLAGHSMHQAAGATAGQQSGSAGSSLTVQRREFVKIQVPRNAQDSRQRRHAGRNLAASDQAGERDDEMALDLSH